MLSSTSVVVFLFLLVSFVRSQQCGRIRASERKYTNCTRAFSLDIVNTDLRSLDDFQWLESIDYNASDNLDPTAKYGRRKTKILVTSSSLL